MGGQWLPVTGILLNAFLVVLASTPLLRPVHEDPGQSPSAPGPSVQQNSSRLLDILTQTVGRVNSVEKKSEAPEMRAGALYTEKSGGQESSSKPDPLGGTGASGRAVPGSGPSGLTTSTTHMTLDSQPVSSGAEPMEEVLAPGALETIALLSPQASPECEQKYSTAPKLCDTASASATLKTVVKPKPVQQSVRTPLGLIFSRPLSGAQSQQWYTSLSSVQIPYAGRKGHSRSEVLPHVPLTPRIPPGLASLPNMLAVTEGLSPASPRRSGMDVTSQLFTMGSGSFENTVAFGTGSVSNGASALLLPSATSPFHPSSPAPLPAPPLFSSPPLRPPLLSPLSSPRPASVSSVTSRTRDSPEPSVSVTIPLTTNFSINSSSHTPVLPLLTDLQPATHQRTVHPEPRVPTSLIPMASLRRSSDLLSASHSSDFTKLSRDAVPTQSPALPHPGQLVPLQDLGSSPPGPSPVTHSVTFRINSKGFSVKVWNLKLLKHQLLNRFLHHQLQLIYHEAFSNFKHVNTLLLRPGSAEVKASLVFGQPSPSALEILWTLYRRVKASRWLLGHLSLAENSLSSDGSNLTDLAPETISISFTLMRPFWPQLLLPGSRRFFLLENQILQLVTPKVSRFYKADPQDRPLLLFSNVNQWVSVHMEYKFQSPISTHFQGLANHLAHQITDPTLQKSSMVANGEKAEVVLYEMRFLILGHPFTMALENKTSPESRRLRGQLTKWLASVLRPLKNFGQVVVDEFQREPLTAKVHAAFLGAGPAKVIIQACVHQALGFLQETEGLQLEMLVPVLGAPSSGASSSPCYGLMLNLLLITLLLVLVPSAPLPTSPRSKFRTSPWSHPLGSPGACRQCPTPRSDAVI